MNITHTAASVNNQNKRCIVSVQKLFLLRFRPFRSCHLCKMVESRKNYAGIVILLVPIMSQLFRSSMLPVSYSEERITFALNCKALFNIGSNRAFDAFLCLYLIDKFTLGSPGGFFIAVIFRTTKNFSAKLPGASMDCAIINPV